MIKRAIFVLNSSEAAEQYLRVLPDLRTLGLSEAMILHLVSALPGPAEPMPELAVWVRHFEAALSKVELALKRGDPVKWIYELARVRRVDLVVISGVPNGIDWDLERVSSPLRTLGVPILYLPEEELEVALTEHVLVAIKAPESLERAVAGLRDWLGRCELRAVRVSEALSDGEGGEFEGVSLETVLDRGDVAATLIEQAEAWGASLLTILAEEGEEPPGGQDGEPVVRPLLRDAHRPVLIWPARSGARVVT